MKNYVWSKKNYIVNSRKYGPLLYVGNSNSVIKLSDDSFQEIKDFVIGKIDKVSDCSKLVKLGALVESDDSILTLHKYSGKMSEFCSGNLELWVCMTNECNFKCPYCFEKKRKDDLNEEIIDKLVEFIKSKKSIKQVIINFYGGEPLLNLDMIFVLYEKVEALGLKTKYQIITNGYLLNKQTIEKLSMIKKMSYQVTIDGTKEVHNTHRPHKTDKDSYQVIIDNLEDFYQFHKDDAEWNPFSIRYNVDKTNAHCFHEVYNYFKEKYGDFYFVYSTPVQDYCCGEQYNSVFFSSKEYSDFLVNNYDKYGIYEDFFPKDKKPFPVCGAACNYFYCVGSDGSLYKCPSQAGHKDKVVYDLKTNKVINNRLIAEFSIDSSPYDDPICKNCFLLYYCMGTCAMHMIFSKKYGSEHSCIPFKYNTERFLEMYYENIILKKKGGKNGNH